MKDSMDKLRLLTQIYDIYWFKVTVDLGYDISF